MRLQFSIKLIFGNKFDFMLLLLQRWLDLCIMQEIALMHEPFYVRVLLVCNAVSSSVNMCPQVWIWPCLWPKPFFFFLSHFTMFFWTSTVLSLLAKCLNFNKSSCIFLYFCVTELLVFLTGRYTWQKNWHTQTLFSVIGNLQDSANVVFEYVWIHFS